MVNLLLPIASSSEAVVEKSVHLVHGVDATQSERTYWDVELVEVLRLDHSDFHTCQPVLSIIFLLEQLSLPMLGSWYDRYRYWKGSAYFQHVKERSLSRIVETQE